jgi:hypothetical protein
VSGLSGPLEVQRTVADVIGFVMRPVLRYT